jgi:hypothetical protein
MEKIVAAEMHYCLAWQGMIDRAWHVWGELGEQGARVSMLLEHVQPLSTEEQDKAVQNRMHAVRSSALMRDVYGEEAETDFRFGIVKVLGAVEGARSGEVTLREFAEEMQSLNKSMAPALEAGRYPMMKVWLGLWSSSVAHLALRMFC